MHAEALFSLAAVHERQHEWTSALKDYQQGTAVLNAATAQIGETRENHLHFHAKYAAYYSQYVSLLMREGQIGHALEVLEQSRGQTMLRMLEEKHIQVRAGGPPALIKRYQQLQFLLGEAADQRLRMLAANAAREELTPIDAKITNYVLEEQRVKAQMQVISPRYAALMGAHPPRLTQLQKLLDSGTLVLEYLLANDSSHVFVLTRTDLQSFSLPDRNTIEALARAVYEAWSVRNGQQTRANQDAPIRLSSAVLGPVAHLLEGYRRTVIIGDGPLRFIPFTALPLPSKAAPDATLLRNHESLIYLRFRS